jgi:hypothetical protein
MSNSSNPGEEILQQEILYLDSLRALNLDTFLSHYHDDVFG